MSLVDERVMVLMTGIPAAGKSTIAELLAKRFDPGVHVKGDVFRRMVVSGRHEMTATPTDEAWRQLRLRYRLGAATADTYFDAGFSVVVQDVVIGSVLGEYVDAIRSTPLVVVVLAPQPEAVVRREAERSKTAYEDAYATVATLDTALREETPRIGMWLDTSNQTAEQSVEEIITRGLADGQVH